MFCDQWAWFCYENASFIIRGEVTSFLKKFMTHFRILIPLCISTLQCTLCCLLISYFSSLLKSYIFLASVSLENSAYGAEVGTMWFIFPMILLWSFHIQVFIVFHAHDFPCFCFFSRFWSILLNWLTAYSLASVPRGTLGGIKPKFAKLYIKFSDYELFEAFMSGYHHQNRLSMSEREQNVAPVRSNGNKNVLLTASGNERYVCEQTEQWFLIFCWVRIGNQTLAFAKACNQFILEKHIEVAHTVRKFEWFEAV